MPANCSTTITYTAALTNGSALPSYVVFTSSNRTFRVYTNDRTKEGVFPITVTASTTGLNYTNTTSFDWTLTVLSNYDYCSYYLAWTAWTGTVLTHQYYLAGDTKKYVQFPPITWTPANCSSIAVTYTATLNNGSALPSIIVFTDSNRTFSIYDSVVANVGDWTIKVRATLATTGANYTEFTWQLTETNSIDYCSYWLTWTYVPTIADKSYMVTDPGYDFTFSNVTWTPANCTSDIEYTVTL